MKLHVQIGAILYLHQLNGFLVYNIKLRHIFESAEHFCNEIPLEIVTNFITAVIITVVTMFSVHFTVLSGRIFCRLEIFE